MSTSPNGDRPDVALSLRCGAETVRCHVRSQTMMETPGRTPAEAGIMPDMEVVGMDGEHIGTVKELRERDFLVDRALHRDVYIPVITVHEIREGVVVLAIPKVSVDNADWEKPPLMGSHDAG